MFNTLKWSKFSLICFSDQQNGRKFENSWIMYNLQALLPPSMNCKLYWILWYAKGFTLVLKNKGMLSFSSSPFPCFSSWTASPSPPLVATNVWGSRMAFTKEPTGFVRQISRWLTTDCPTSQTRLEQWRWKHLSWSWSLARFRWFLTFRVIQSELSKSQNLLKR